MKCYAVIDANVLVSALLSQSENTATMQILGHLINETIILIYSGEIIREYKEVLVRNFLIQKICHFMKWSWIPETRIVFL